MGQLQAWFFLCSFSLGFLFVGVCLFFLSVLIVLFWAVAFGWGILFSHHATVFLFILLLSVSVFVPPCSVICTISGTSLHSQPEVCISPRGAHSIPPGL